MESLDLRDGLVDKRKSLSVDPLLMRGDYVTRRPINQNRKSTTNAMTTTTMAKTGSCSNAWIRGDNALPVIINIVFCFL